MANKEFLEKIKSELEQKKDALRKELSGFANESPGDKKDWNARYPQFEGSGLEDEADEVEEYGSLLSIEKIMEKKLKDIDAALEKIEKNTYGICEKCGVEISQARLEVCPEARWCSSCIQ
ncbi:MAG: TraR/DksA family transcriptional regulator [Candidatus Paceibacterota bacterium]|jgi:RNA polymerase-binding transcription factor DksA